MLPCMGPKDYRPEMLSLATKCQLVVELMIELVEQGTKPDAELVECAARFMAEKDRLGPGEMNLEWNHVIAGVIRTYKKALPVRRDFRNVADLKIPVGRRKKSAKCIIEFFSAISRQALWYFEFPPGFDAIFAHLVAKAFRELERA